MTPELQKWRERQRLLGQLRFWIALTLVSSAGIAAPEAGWRMFIVGILLYVAGALAGYSIARRI